jgi:hypothetical protein
MYFQHLCTHNDRNGNPRRLYVLVSDGKRIAAWDEGHAGHHAVPGIWRDAAYNAERVDIKPGLYNELRRELPSPKWAHDVPGYEHLRVSTVDYPLY